MASTTCSTADVLGPGRVVEVELGRLDCHDLGQGRPILLLHGLMLNAAHWRGVVPGLIETFRCVIPTLPLGAHTTPVTAIDRLTVGGLADAVEELVRAWQLED